VIPVVVGSSPISHPNKINKKASLQKSGAFLFVDLEIVYRLRYRVSALKNQLLPFSQAPATGCARVARLLASAFRHAAMVVDAFEGDLFKFMAICFCH